VPVVKPVRTKEGFLMFPKDRRPGRKKLRRRFALTGMRDEKPGAFWDEHWLNGAGNFGGT